MTAEVIPVARGGFVEQSVVNGADVLPMPLAPPLWLVASLSASRSEMRSILGEPHKIETDPRCTCGGEEDAWAYLLPTGHRVIVIVDSGPGGAYFASDPPDLEPVLRFLRID